MGGHRRGRRQLSGSERSMRHQLPCSPASASLIIAMRRGSRSSHRERHHERRPTSVSIRRASLNKAAAAGVILWTALVSRPTRPSRKSPAHVAACRAAPVHGTPTATRSCVFGGLFMQTTLSRPWTVSCQVRRTVIVTGTLPADPSVGALTSQSFGPSVYFHPRRLQSRHRRCSILRSDWRVNVPVSCSEIRRLVCTDRPLTGTVSFQHPEGTPSALATVSGVDPDIFC